MSLVVCLLDFHLHFKPFLLTDEFIKFTQLVCKQLQVFFLDFAISGALYFDQLLQIQSDAAEEEHQDFELHLEVCRYFAGDSPSLSD